MSFDGLRSLRLALGERSVSAGRRAVAPTLAALALVLLPSAVEALDFTVDNTSSDSDAMIGDDVCATTGNVCTLRAALQEANAETGLDNITFSVTSITLTTGLPAIENPVNIDGGPGMVEIFGGRVMGTGGVSCFSFEDTASGSTVQNLIIHGCNSDGIAAVGFGYTFSDNWIGITGDGMGGEVASGNGGDGIDMTTVAEDWPYTSMLPPLPDLLTIAAAGAGALAGALMRTPNTISGNVISGNELNGIGMNGENTTLNVVTLNFIGTDSTGTSAIPNGTAGGVQHGVRIFGNAFGNFIGPGNVISGNDQPGSNGVSIEGEVPWPNVVAGNIVGPSSTLVTDLGNDEAGITVAASPSPAPSVVGDPPENPTDYSALIGPLNVVGYNKGGNPANPENVNNTVGGITITGGATTRRVKVYGNFVGVGESVTMVGTFLDLGNASDGINVSTPDNEIGGSLPYETNFVGGNGLHGIAVRGGSSVVDNVVRGNVVGGVLDGASLFVQFGNAQDGIFVPNADQTTIASNLVAGNGRNGIRIGAQSGGDGSSNWITENSVYGNSVSATGLGIDLNDPENAANPTDALNPGGSANLSQNAPVLDSAAYDPMTGTTQVGWSFTSAPNRSYDFEVFASESGPDASGQTFLGVFSVTTDAMGLASGTNVVTPLSPIDTRGTKITLTATDVTSGTRPDGSTDPLRNTSELSNAVTVPQPGQLRFTAATASLMAAESAGSVMFLVERINGSDGPVQVDYTVSDGTAVAPGDYTATASGTLQWLDGDADPKPIVVNVIDDALDEPDETVAAMISNALGGAVIVSPSMATLTIQDDDAEPNLSIGDVSSVEGNSGTTTFSFTASLSAVSGKNVSFTAITADGTATDADDDYEPINAMFAISAGASSVQVDVLVNGDVDDEMADETFFVNLSSLVNAAALDVQGQGTILDDDGVTPTLSVDDPMVTEGDAGTVQLVFTISRSPGAGVSSVSAQTVAGGSATGGGVDYDDLAATVVQFADTETTKTVSVTVHGDTDDESDETVQVMLSGATMAMILDDLGVGTIVDDDDPVPDVTVNDPSVAEGDAGTTILTFTLTRSSTSGTSSVSVQTQDGSATAGVDYVAVTATQVDFADGQAMVPVTVTVNGDDVFEGNETVLLDVVSVANANVTDNQGSGSIQDDDPQPSLSIDDVTLDEGDAATTPFTFTVTLSNPSTQTITVAVTSADGTATVADNDYVAQTTTLTFLPLDVSETVTVDVDGDTDVEPNETFSIALSSPTNSSVADGQGVGTIQNDDATGPSFSIGDRTLAEGNAGTTLFSFDITRTDTNGAASVTASTADGTATAGSDYTALAGQLVDFADGTATVAVTVEVAGDLVFEPDETFVVNLSTPSVGFDIADGQGLGSITNDDGQPTVSVGDVAAGEGNVGGTTFSFVVSLSNPSSQTVTVTAATADDTATVTGGDYLAAGPSAVTFPPLSTMQTFAVTVTGDTTIESDETFFVDLGAPGNATLGDAQGVGTIQNDDSADKTFSGPSATGTGNVSISFLGGGTTCGFASGELIDAPPGIAPVPPTAPPPGDWIFPHGLATFEIDGCASGSILDFTVTYPQPLPAETAVFKYGPTSSDPTDHWYQLPSIVAGNTVTFQITDGGLGDSDLTVDGEISDPVGPAFRGSTAITIPVADWRGLAALLLALAVVGVLLARGGGRD